MAEKKPKMRKGTFNLSEQELKKQGVGQKARRLVKGGISNTEFVRGKGVINKTTGKPLTGTLMVDGKLLRYKGGKRVTTSGIGMASAAKRKPGAKSVSPASSAGKAQGTTAAAEAKPGKMTVSATERRMKQGKSTPTGRPKGKTPSELTGMSGNKPVSRTKATFWNTTLRGRSTDNPVESGGLKSVRPNEGAKKGDTKLISRNGRLVRVTYDGRVWK